MVQVAKFVKYKKAIEAILAHDSSHFSSKDINIDPKMLQSMATDGFIFRQGRGKEHVVYDVSSFQKKILRAGLERSKSV